MLLVYVIGNSSKKDKDVNYHFRAMQGDEKNLATFVKDTK